MVFASNLMRRAVQRTSTSAARAPLRRYVKPQASASISASLLCQQSPCVAAFASSSSSSIAFNVEHQEQSLTGVIAAAAAVTAVMGLGKMWWDASNENTNAGPGAMQASGTLQHSHSGGKITKDDLKWFFTDLKGAVGELFSQLPALDAKFREHIKEQKLELSETEYKQALLQQLFGIMQSIEEKVIGTRNWDQATFAAAMEKYQDDPEVQKEAKELEVLMKRIFPAPEIPAHITPEVVLDILKVLVEGMETAMNDMLAHARKEGITDANKAMEEFQQFYLEQVEQITFKEMQKHNIANEVFNFALQKFHAENAEFKKKVEEIYAMQAAAFRSMGLKVESG